MKPVGIYHINMNHDGDRIAVVDIELTDDDKQMIHDYHMSEDGAEDYDEDDVSMLVYINITPDNRIWGFHYCEQSYYPEDYGEHEIDNKVLPNDLEELCVDFVKENYIGHEDEYEHC